MKIHWDKIPKCFTYVTIDSTNHFGLVCAYDCIPDKNESRWIPYNQDAQGYRLLLEHEEYELDGNEKWEESLQQRPGTDIKHCPFCGSKDIELIFDAGTWGYTDDKYYIKCQNCKCQTDEVPTEKEAKDKWNARCKDRGTKQ